MRLVLLAAAAAVALPAAANAQSASELTPYTLSQSTYTQDFDSLAGSTNANIAGFQRVEFGRNADTSYRVGNGAGNNLAGDIYSFGATGSGERALGSVGSGSLAPTYFGGIFTNGLGSTISSLSFAYTGEQWRVSNSGDDALFFEFSTDASDLVSGTWSSISALDFAAIRDDGTSLGAGLDGNAAANQSLISSTIANLSIANGASFGFRWRDANSGGNDQGLAVDNLSITAGTLAAAVPEPASWAMMIVGFGVVGGALRRRKAAGQTVRFA